MINHFKTPSFLSLIDKIKNKNSILIDDIIDAMSSTIITFVQKSLKKTILVISTERKKDLLYKNLSSFNNNLLEFLPLDTSFAKPNFDVIGQRFETLSNLLKDKNHILLTTPNSILQKVPFPDDIKDLNISLKTNNLFDFELLLKKLNDFGYENVSIITDKAQVARRGGIVDIFPANTQNPYRIEFVSDEIESIRIFDIASQRSIEKVSSVNIFPAKFLEATSILSYLNNDYIVIFDDLYSIEENLVSSNLLKKKATGAFLSLEDFFFQIKDKKTIYLSEKKIEDLSSVTYKKEKEKFFNGLTFEIFNKEIKAEKWLHPFISFIDFLKIDKYENILEVLPDLLQKNLKLSFLTNSDAEKTHILELLKEKNIALEKIIFEKGFLSSGFILQDIFLGIIPYNEITHRKIIRRQKFRSATSMPYAEYHHLSIGDLVVHYHSGIGKYIGTEKHLNHLGIETEFLIIEYAKHSKLYVPISQAHLISKYIGSTEEKPPLHLLGSNKWQKTKNIAQKQIIGYASDLLHIQAQREIEGGFSYPEDSKEMLLFEMDFPYQETTDQINAITEIKKDMLSPKATDRLICGDVGYGKTEVAMRAAFKAVYDGKKQVAVLVPTTVLALQHFDTFKERMASFPINIDIVSRFNTAKQNKSILEKTKNGNTDILIGTHRLLSKDVFFKDLGLIIIDEEQRFGVRAKEHLKKLKKGVDCLTLSATPIPRTLYMSLIKAKDMSVINTPPQDRLPIKTIIAENEDAIIKNAILREKERQGQVFFIHNRVESIHQRAKHITKLLPNLTYSIVHGQMPTGQVDSIFHKFKQGLIDILFATTIIENGVDIPNANTIIIDRSDTFGLAALYQLRGRVGRWNRSAYAYFLTPQNRQLSEISQKRLHALLEAPGYGGGMKIAMRDLEIRGAGDILGVKQSGQISNIGFHLYCKLLKKTIDSLKDKKETNFIETKIEFPYPAFLPSEYIPHENLRMEIYYRLGEITSFASLETLSSEIIDRFGPLPQEVKELLSLTRIKIFANQNNFTFLKFAEFTLIAEKHFKNKTIRKNLLLPKKDSIFEKKVINLLENF